MTPSSWQWEVTGINFLKGNCDELVRTLQIIKQISKQTNPPVFRKFVLTSNLSDPFSLAFLVSSLWCCFSDTCLRLYPLSWILPAGSWYWKERHYCHYFRMSPFDLHLVMRCKTATQSKTVTSVVPGGSLWDVGSREVIRLCVTSRTFEMSGTWSVSLSSLFQECCQIRSSSGIFMSKEQAVTFSGVCTRQLNRSDFLPRCSLPLSKWWRVWVILMHKKGIHVCLFNAILYNQEKMFTLVINVVILSACLVLNLGHHDELWGAAALWFDPSAGWKVEFLWVNSNVQTALVPVHPTSTPNWYDLMWLTRRQSLGTWRLKSVKSILFDCFIESRCSVSTLM